MEVPLELTFPLADSVRTDQEEIQMVLMTATMETVTLTEVIIVTVGSLQMKICLLSPRQAEAAEEILEEEAEEVIPIEAGLIRMLTLKGTFPTVIW